jgi:dihydrofolate synthase / folylpolyglutamate synthase
MLRTYAQVSDYLAHVGFPNSMDRTVVVKDVLDRLGNPHEGIRFVQIGGTKGKGSTSCFLESILNAAKLRTGVFFSPACGSFLDQIRLNGRDISEEEFINSFHKIKSVVPDRYLNYFVFLTLIAIYTISSRKPDIGILEVGLGGITDPTSGIDPKLVLITNVFREHEGVLGFGIETVAKAKATLIRDRVPSVFGQVDQDLLPIFQEQAEFSQSKLYSLGKDFHVDSREETFSYWSGKKSFNDLHLSLIGQQQHTNAALAIFALEMLKVVDDFQFECSVVSGLSTAWLRGRFEYLQRTPDIVYDVAHTPESCEYLANMVRKRYKKEDVTVLVSFMKSQLYWKEMIKIVSSCCYRIVGAPIYFHPGRSSIDPSDICQEAATWDVETEEYDSIVTAFFSLRSCLKERETLVLDTSAGIGPILDFYKR